MNKRLLVSAVAVALGAPLAVSAAETPTHSVTGNFGIFSNYVFRGVSQTSEKPAFQGGFDYAHKSGVYVGTWGSNVSWLADTAAYTDSSMELDVYGGYKGSIVGDLGYDVGAIVYYYPGEKIAGADNANTGEVYAGLSWKWLSLKLSYAVTEYFGFVDSEGTLYADVSANVPIADTGLTILAHVGYARIAGDSAFACTVLGSGATTCSNDKAFGYTDWKLGLSYALPKDYTVGAFAAGTNNDIGYVSPINGKNWGESQYVVYVQKTF